ncbi:MAG TPA: hypothetical protein VLE73_03420 [Candidatus Saccharimonadales bacterium]|nr:hypothetical protein [Candidatus Saccharimonadales bacterium]
MSISSRISLAVSNKNVITAGAVAAVLAIAALVIWHSMASGFFSAAEAETGVAGPAQVVNDTTASGGKAVQFMAAAPTPPPPTPTPTPTPTPPPSPGSRPDPFPAGMKPDATNTGVVAGTSLTVVSGNITYSSSSNGQTINGKDFHGFVKVTGANITFTNCIFRGQATSSNNALLDTESSTGTITVKDSEFVPSNPSATIDGMWLVNTKVYRANVHGTVDGIKAASNSLIQNSYIHDMQWFASDPNQGGGETHNDAIQILEGNNIVLNANTLYTGGTQSNSAVQLTQDFAAVSNVTITNNWVDYGGCTLNLTQKPLASVSVGPVTGNRFGRHQGFSNCAILIGTKTTLTQNSGNVWDDTGAAIPAPQQHD